MLKNCPTCHSDYEDTLGTCPRNHEHAPSRASLDPLIGNVIEGRYKINELLGKGAMGVVYKATQLSDGTEAAIKVLHTHLSYDADSIKRFQDEANAAASLNHPHIVKLQTLGILPSGQPFIAMEFLAGRTLAQLLKERPRLGLQEALHIICQACEALAEAHSHGILHRDIKPANIMLLNRMAQDNFVVVLDFSIAKVINKVSDVDTTTPGLIFGSPAYMSPERFMGHGGDFRSDIYSLGIILFLMLAGRAPFRSSDLYTLMKEHVSTNPPKIQDLRSDIVVPERLEQIIERALAKKPEDRHANVKQLLSELREISKIVAEQATESGDTSSAANRSVPTITTEEISAPISSATDGIKIFNVDHGLTPLVGDTAAIGPTEQRSLIVKGSKEKTKISIRPKNRSPQLPLKIAAGLVIISIVGAGFWLNTTPKPDTTKSLTEQVSSAIKRKDLNSAADIVRTWTPTAKSGPDQDVYANACCTVAKAYMQKQEYGLATELLTLVPANTKASTEARGLLTRCRKSARH